MKKFIALACLLFLAQAVNSAVIEEFSLKSHGIAGLRVEGIEKEECLSFVFIKENPSLKPEEYVFFSINAGFEPVQEGGASIKVFVNDRMVKEAKPEGFRNGWARILIGKNFLVDGNNSVKACAMTSKAITVVSINDGSLIGSYKSPDFSQPNAFQKIPSTFTPLEKETITVAVRLKNYGSEKALAKLRWRQKDIEFPEVELIDGNTEMEGFIEPGQEMVMQYRVKLNKALKLDLPKAAAYYTNVFGEEEMILSNQPTLQVMQLNISLKGVFVLDSQPVAGAKEATAMLSIHNDGAKVENARISIELPEGLNTESIHQEISSLNERETKYLPLTLKAGRAGSYRLNCLIELPDYNKKYSCQENFVEFREQSLPVEAGAGALVLVIGVIIYLYIYSWSRKP